MRKLILSGVLSLGLILSGCTSTNTTDTVEESVETTTTETSTQNKDYSEKIKSELKKSMESDKRISKINVSTFSKGNDYSIQVFSKGIPEEEKSNVKKQIEDTVANMGYKVSLVSIQDSETNITSKVDDTNDKINNDEILTVEPEVEEPTYLYKDAYNGLALESMKDINNEYGVRIGGKIVNTSSNNYSYVGVNFSIYDMEGNKIGNVMDNLSGLNSGEVWKYETTYVDTEGKFRYQIESIDAY